MSAIFIWRALRNFATANFEENVEEMVGTTREAAGGDSTAGTRPRRVATEPGGNETGSLGGPGYETGDKTAATAGDKRDGGDR